MGSVSISKVFMASSLYTCTTRGYWMYYTFETPPLFAVLAHGMAAVAFWRAGLLLKSVDQKLKTIFILARKSQNDQL
jgi:hypothetical protein